jgi:hypothetical protein
MPVPAIDGKRWRLRALASLPSLVTMEAEANLGELATLLHAVTRIC